MPSVLRNVAERLSRNVVLARRLPQEFGGGLMRVSPAVGGLKYWRRNIAKVDPFLFSVIGAIVHGGDKVWDIGANVGLFTFSSAYRSGKDGYVLAVEADVEAVALLLATSRGLNGENTAKVDILCAAVSDGGSRLASFQIARRSRASNAIEGFGRSQTGGFIETRKVPAFSLDELTEFFPCPDVVKIDVEGAEQLVFAGSRQLIEKVRPTIICEVGAANQEKIGAVLRSADYRMFDIEKPDWPEVAVPTWNCIARPRGRP